MSITASEIVTELTTMLREQLVNLHNQTVNDVTAIVGRMEVRLTEYLDALQLEQLALAERISATESAVAALHLDVQQLATARADDA